MIGKYTAGAIGAAAQAILAGILASGGVIQLTPGQQVLTGVIWIFIASVAHFGDKK